MQKYLLLAFASCLALGASSQLLHQNPVSVASEKYMGQQMATRMYSNDARAARIAAKADGDIDTLYTRPNGTYLWACRVGENNGYRGLLVPAYTDMTWLNKTLNAPEGAQWAWYTIDHESGDYYLSGTDVDFVENERPSLLKNFFSLPGSNGLYWLGKDSSNPPLLVLNNSDDYYEYGGLMQYGDAPRIMTDTTTAEFTYYPVTSYDQFSADYQAFNAGYFYLANSTWQYGANDPDASWLNNLKRYDFADNPDLLTSAKLRGVVQMLDEPNAPYILNAVNWVFGYYSSADVTVTLNIYEVNGTEIGDIIATVDTRLPRKANTTSNSFTTTAVFPLTTVADDGGEEDGIVIKSAVALEVTGFHDAWEDGTFTIFTAPVVGHYRDKALNENRFDAYATLDLVYNGNEYTQFQDCSFGYYLDDEEPNDSVYYITNFRYSLDMTMPWLTPDTNVVEIAKTGGSVVLPISACKSSDEWAITLEDGSELPEWLTIDYMDEMYRDIQYNQYSELTFTAAALPNGTAAREAKVLLSYRGCAEAVITVKQGEGGTPTNPADVTGDGNIDVADINAVINAMLGRAANPKADVTGDNNIDVADINAVINAMLGK